MIALVDCNNFFASCERLFRPDLAHKPVAVLSSNDGCIVARSNEVKALGVPMGAPHFQVRDVLEKHGVTLFSSNFSLYSNISQRILDQLQQFSPNLEVYSIDEAFMDISQLPIRDFESWGAQIKQTVQTNVGMPVSVGIAPTKTLAKLASDWAKKHSGVCVLDPEADSKNYQMILEQSDVGDIWGIGRQLSKRLRVAGVHTAWHLRQTDPTWIKVTMGKNGKHTLAELSGKPMHAVEELKKPQKSMVASRSFGSSVSQLHQLETAVASFTAQAAARLRKYDQVAEIFGVFVTYKEGDEHAKYQAASMHLMPPSNNTSELTEVALRLTEQLFFEGRRYKKAGVFAYQLTPAQAVQTSLLDTKSTSERERQKQLMQTIDSINARFGTTTMQLASVDLRTKSWESKHQLRSPAYTTSWAQLPVVKG